MKPQQLTNFRASGGKDDAVRLTPPKRLTLEQAIAYIDDDELVEVTPKSIRLRKRHLDPHARKRASRQKDAACSRRHARCARGVDATCGRSRVHPTFTPITKPWRLYSDFAGLSRRGKLLAFYGHFQ